LYRNLSGKSRVHVRKKAVRITPDPLGVSVETEDGATYRGDIVVGADGIHSITRSEMWRIAEMEQPGFITQEEKSGELQS
jgi:2-polyprenyl-6-methoxyphenol hydroxylase-like FAD-dependent oxidoreductase